MEEAKERIREIGMRALQKEDFSNALRAAETLARLDGIDLSQVVKVQHSGEVECEHGVGNSFKDMIRAIASDPESKKRLIKNINKKREAASAPDGND